MKVYNVSQVHAVYQKQKAQKIEKVGRPMQQSLDIQISDRGKEFQFAMERLKQVSDVRREKVDAISEKIKDGTYKVDTLKLAQSMKSYLISDVAE